VGECSCHVHVVLVFFLEVQYSTKVAQFKFNVNVPVTDFLSL
jgi:hypothetical protein